MVTPDMHDHSPQAELVMSRAMHEYKSETWELVHFHLSMCQACCWVLCSLANAGAYTGGHDESVS